jgi:hypothetical protein
MKAGLSPSVPGLLMPMLRLPSALGASASSTTRAEGRHALARDFGALERLVSLGGLKVDLIRVRQPGRAQHGIVQSSPDASMRSAALQ